MSNIIQIFISSNNSKPSYKISLNSTIIKEFYPECKYLLFNNNSIEDFLVDNFDDEILETYRRLIPYSYKADFARFCILYILGGWYFDIGLICQAKVSLPEDINLLFFRDINIYTHTSWACASGLIFSKKQHPIIKKAIELIIKNVSDEYYGLTPLCPTGPSLFGRAIASVGIDEKVLIGDFIELTPNFKKKNKAMVMPDGTIFALNKQALGGDLKSLGCQGTNNYNDFWNNKNIYQKKIF